jgi:hypothetical protein
MWCLVFANQKLVTESKSNPRPSCRSSDRLRSICECSSFTVAIVPQTIVSAFFWQQPELVYNSYAVKSAVHQWTSNPFSAIA